MSGKGTMWRISLLAVMAAWRVTASPDLPAHPAETVKIACIGDSITYGTGLADRNREAYPAQLQQMLDRLAPKRYEVRNFGNPGRGVYLDSKRGTEMRGFRHMPEHRAALAWQPDVVISNLGINDCGEYIKAVSGERERGQFVRDYLALLGDYAALPHPPRFLIWTKLSPLNEGHAFYRSPEPFLMQEDLERVAREMAATGLDAQEPLRDALDTVLLPDRIHPNAEGSRLLAEMTVRGLFGRTEDPVTLPPEIAGRCETWLCAGQSNMQKGWGEFNRTPEERRRVAEELVPLDNLDIRFWDFNDGSWLRLTPSNALGKCAVGVSFAIRRAKAAGKPIAILYVAAGGAPTEAFLPESILCAVGPDGRPRYPHLARIATNRHRLDGNRDFPCAWCAREYPKRRGNLEEARWWPVSALYDHGIRRIRHLPLTGILWYQGESNATANVTPDTPLHDDYLKETLHAAVTGLRGDRNLPFLMMGLPVMNRPWAPYRMAQRTVCAETGAIYLDTFGAGLGDPGDVHPRDKRPFAELAARAADAIIPPRGNAR